MSETPHCPACGRSVSADDRFCPACGTSLGGEQTADDAELEARLHDALAPSYLLVRRLGGGGMGTVFLAREPALKRLVAVKVLSPRLAADPTARQRFEREAQAAAGLSHPNVVSVYGVGALADGTPFFVMQYVEGESMAARVERDGPLAPDDARRVLGQVASALAAAHAKGVIHRDIKPANILYDAESGRVLVSDFGIAAVRPTAQVAAPATLTQTGMAIGTPQYMSPEQLLAEKVTEKTDVYSLGLLGYELLAGRGPFEVSSPGELVAAHLRDRPKKLSELRADIDPELESSLAACLAKQADDRPTAAEIAQRLTPGAAALLEWPPPGLDLLLGRLSGVTRPLAAGSALFAGSATLLVALATRLGAAHASLGTLLLWLLGVAGTLVLLIAGWHVVRLGRAASRAAQAGFGWLTILEVLADGRGDTGALIAGTREYAALDATQRSRLRWDRIKASGGLAAAALLPAPLFALVVWLGSRGLGTPAMLPLIVLGVPLLIALGTRRLAVAEARLLEPTRGRLARHRTRGVPAARLVQPWYESFETTRRGQPLGAGRRGRPGTGWATAGALTLVVAGAAVVATPYLIVGAVGPAVWQVTVPKFRNTLDKVRMAQGARRFRLPIDPAISPMDAGRAFHVLSGAAPEGRFRMQPLPRTLPPWAPADDDPFRMNAGALPTLSQDIWKRVESGFTPDERRALARFAAHPAFTELAVLSRAGAIDFYGARFQLPFPEDATALEMPIPRFAATKEVAYAQTVRAAWLYSQGRVAPADTALREVVSFGFALADGGATLLEQLIGVVVVGIGRGGLENLYRASGREAEAVAIRATVDSTYAIVEQLEIERRRQPGPATSVALLRRQLAEGLVDSTALGGLRWEFVLLTGAAPCTNVRELVFGPAPDLERALARARDDLVRFPSEAELFAVMRETPRRFRVDMLSGEFPRLVFRVSRVAGALMGNDRLAGCVGLLLSAGVWF